MFQAFATITTTVTAQTTTRVEDQAGAITTAGPTTTPGDEGLVSNAE